MTQDADPATAGSGFRGAASFRGTLDHPRPRSVENAGLCLHGPLAGQAGGSTLILSPQPSSPVPAKPLPPPLPLHTPLPPTVPRNAAARAASVHGADRCHSPQLSPTLSCLNKGPKATRASVVQGTGEIEHSTEPRGTSTLGGAQVMSCRDMFPVDKRGRGPPRAGPPTAAGHPLVGGAEDEEGARLGDGHCLLLQLQLGQWPGSGAHGDLGLVLLVIPWGEGERDWGVFLLSCSPASAHGPSPEPPTAGGSQAITVTQPSHHPLPAPYRCEVSGRRGPEPSRNGPSSLAVALLSQGRTHTPSDAHSWGGGVRGGDTGQTAPGRHPPQRMGPADPAPHLGSRPRGTGPSPR